MNKILIFGALILSNAIYAQIPTSNLEAYFPFNGNANDQSTNSNNGTVFGATLTNDRFGNANSAYSFDGIDDWINLGDDAGLHYSSTKSNSISLWFNSNSNSSAYQTLLRYDEKDTYDGMTTTSRDIFILRARNADNDMDLDFEYIFGTYAPSFSQTNEAMHISNDYGVNDWHHLVAMKDLANDSVFIYLNGVQVLAEIDLSLGNWETTGQFLMLGRYKDNSSNEFFSGTMDDLRIYNDVLTECEILALYNEGTSAAVDFGITQSGNTMTSNQANATYQWIDCESQTPIPGATNQSYTGTMNNYYAVIVNTGLCSDTSECTRLSITGIELIAEELGNNVIVYPNPIENTFSVDLGENVNNVKMTVTDLTGKHVKSEIFKHAKVLSSELVAPAGVYLLIIEAENKRKVMRIVKE